ncbi:MAG: hypothetical protein KA817_00745 [Flavobacteriales bacterium]|nr:hypothetical protein [Flavobacteriales bacterium]
MDWLSGLSIILILLAAFVQFLVSQRNEKSTEVIQNKLIQAQEELLENKRNQESIKRERDSLISNELEILNRRICQEINGLIHFLDTERKFNSRESFDINKLHFTKYEIRNFFLQIRAHGKNNYIVDSRTQIQTGFDEAYLYIQPFFPEIQPEIVKYIVRALKFTIPEINLPDELLKTISVSGKKSSRISHSAREIEMQLIHCINYLEKYGVDYLHEQDQERIRNQERIS